MTTPRWQRLRELFDTAIELPVSDRPGFLRRECGEHETNLRLEVEALLAETVEDDTVIRDVISGEAARLRSRSAPCQIGPYFVLRELGHGGMGTVYLAERRGEFRQQVAIKLATRCFDDPSMLLRFRGERQILANLHHPNIAQVLDGGSTEEGTPYVVMDYIDGEPITTYCDRLGLHVEARLRLFRKVCEAVHFAHQNLVVHRDIKPANLLVNEQGEPTLLDFGIAKLLDAEAAGVDAVKTEAVARMMTPAYASPEQIRGKPITTACDVYALGVLLYELLTGKRPFLSTESESYSLQKAICEDDPVRPSALRPGLSRDLDAIVMQAMRKQPADRYASVEHLSADVERHLKCYPVQARNRTWQYNASRFLRRNKAFAPVVAAFVLLIGGSLVGLNYQAKETAAQRDRAVAALERAEAAQQLVEKRRLEAERNQMLAQQSTVRAISAESLAIKEAAHARDEAAAAQAVAQFLEGLFGEADPMKSAKRNETAREMLERGAQKLSIELADQPATQARLQDSIARAFLAIGETAKAADLIEAALKTRLELFGEHHNETAGSWQSKGHLHLVRGELEQSVTGFEKALRVFESEGARGEASAADVLVSMSEPFLSRSQFSQCNDLLQKAVALCKRDPQGRESILRDALRRLAGLSSRQGNHKQAERYARESLAISKRLYREDHPEQAPDWSSLGLVLKDLGRFPEAVEAIDNATRIYTRTLGPDNPRLAVIYNNRATVAYIMGDYESAERYFTDAHRIRVKTNGPDEVTTMRMLNNIGVVRFQQRDFAGAVAIYVEVLERQRRIVGPETRDVADTLNNMGRAYLGQQDLVRAEQHLRESLEIRRKVQGADHPLVAVALDGLGILLRERKDYNGAQELHLESLAIRTAKLGPKHPAVSVPLLGLGYCRMQLGDMEAAERYLREGLAIREAGLPKDHWEIAEIQSVLGAVLLRRGKLQDAETLLAPAHALLIQKQDEETVIVRQAAEWLDELRVAVAAERASRR